VRLKTNISSKVVDLNWRVWSKSIVSFSGWICW